MGSRTEVAGDVRAAAASHSTQIWRIQGLTKERSSSAGRVLIRLLGAEIARGERLALIGPSGCGKSTILDMLAMLLPPDHVEEFQFRPSASELVDVRSCWERAAIEEMTRCRSHAMGYVLQTGGLLPFLSLRENIALPARLLGRSSTREIDAIGRLLGIEAQLDKRPAQVSVGERQRASVARALVHRPCVVLADEPTASVDPVNASLIMESFLRVAEEDGATLVLATHDRDLAARSGFRALAHHAWREGDVAISEFAS